MQLEDSLKKMLKLISAEDGSSTSTDCRYSPKHFSRQNLNSKSLNAIPPKIFALRTREDSEIANVWTKHILPRLASILSPNVGSDYSATLVRQGLSESSSAAVIRIQSANGQSEPIREVIRRKINQICDDNNRERIDVHFSKGKLMLLGSPSPRLPMNEMVQIEDDDENDENEFPHYKRYWKYPGMGASIGMRCSKTVSATLGGYILLDKKRYLISVDHFIQESEWTKDIQHSPGGMPLELTSPSLSDVEYMTADLNQTVRDIRAKIDDKMKQDSVRGNEVSLDDLQSSDPDFSYLGNIYECFLGFLKELDRDQKDFVLGSLHYRCVPKARESQTSALLISSETKIFHRMDWSLFRVVPERTGDNRHRYRFDPDSNAVDFLTEGTSPKGAGENCTDYCDVEKNAEVHYVGQRNGRLNARVNTALMLNSCDGHVTQEWTLVPSEQKIGGERYAGDSGAWIIRDGDFKVMGILWGWKDGQLLFTPSRDVFNDVSDLVPDKEICLPNSSASPKPSLISMSGSSVICQRRNSKAHKPKSYTFTGLTRSTIERLSKPSIPVARIQGCSKLKASPPVRQTEGIMETEGCRTKDRSISPVPSLSSSTTLSPTTKPRSPPCYSASRETMGERLSPAELGNHVGLEPAVVIRGDSETAELVPTAKEASQYDPVHQKPKDSPLGFLGTENKHSIRYIVTAPPDLKTSEQLLLIAKLKPLKRPGTWPSSITQSMREGLRPLDLRYGQYEVDILS